MSWFRRHDPDVMPIGDAFAVRKDKVDPFDRVRASPAYAEAWNLGKKLAEDRLALERSCWDREVAQRRKWADIKRRNEI